MLTTATSEVVRLVSTVVRLIDAELVAAAARNAEASVLAAHVRLLDELATLDDLSALDTPVRVPAVRVPVPMR
jgi:hypothetical protein